MSLPIENIRYLQNGEPSDEEVFNRPTQDLAEMAQQKIQQVEDDSLANAIVFAIALGG